MIFDKNDFNKEATYDIALKMATAAITAPKACGEDSLIVKIIEGEELSLLADKSIELGDKYDLGYFSRDGKLLKNCHYVLLLGIENKPLGLKNCGFCGFENCSSCKKAGGHCALKLADLGIALGSAVSVAMDSRIDNRLAFSLGRSSIDLGFFNEKVTNAYAIPINISGKNIFFDREAIQQK